MITISTQNPWSGAVIGEYPVQNAQDLKEVTLRSGKVSRDWQGTSTKEKTDLFLSLARVLRASSEKAASIAVNEMGKTIREARAEVEKCAWLCEYYAENASLFLKNDEIASDAGKSYVTWQPLGAILAIMPWNFPYWQVFRFAVPALMAGNTGILKHASNVSGCSLFIQELFKEAGFPDHVFQSVVTDAKGVEALIADPVVKAVTLTGSEAAGMKVAATAGHYLKKTVLELGGSDPFVVLEDADLEEASTFAVKSRVINNGQSCIAAKRFIVTEKVYDAFLKLFTAKIQLLKTGDPMLDTTDIGPMSRPDLLEGLEAQVAQSIKSGAVVVCGCKRAEQNSNLYIPGILSEVKSGMPAYDEELFGPVAAVIRVKDEAEALKVANDTPYGLAGSVWTKDKARGEKFALAVEAGSVFVNGMVKSDPRLPFGGVKLSGYGRELSLLGIHEFVNAKTVWIK